MQIIKDLPLQTKHCFLILRKRRYVCNCGKHFYQNYHFLPKYLHRTKRLTSFSADSFHKVTNISTIAARANISTFTVNRILDTVSFPKPKLPRALSIDELKGNASIGKYQCILVDPIIHSVLDIFKHFRTRILMITNYFFRLALEGLFGMPKNILRQS